MKPTMRVIGPDEMLGDFRVREYGDVIQKNKNKYITKFFIMDRTKRNFVGNFAAFIAPTLLSAYRRMYGVAIILVIVLCMGALIGLRLAINDLKDRTADLKNDAAHLIGENEEMDEKIDQVGSIQSVVDIAKEELGLVEPCTVIFETGPAPATESAEGN